MILDTVIMDCLKEAIGLVFRYKPIGLSNPKKEVTMKEITPKRHLPSTIIMGIMLIVAIIIAITAYTVNYGALIQEMAQNASEGAEGAGKPVAGIAAGAFGGLAILMVFFLAVAAVSGLSIFCLIKSIFNVKTSMSAIKIINIVYLCLSGLLLLTTIVRVILLVAASI